MHTHDWVFVFTFPPSCLALAWLIWRAVWQEKKRREQNALQLLLMQRAYDYFAANAAEEDGVDMRGGRIVRRAEKP